MKTILFFVLLFQFSVQADGIKEQLKSDSYTFKTQNGSKKIEIFSNQTKELIAEYVTVEPVVTLVAINDIMMIVRQLRSQNYDHMVDVWVALDSLQIVRSRHDTASAPAKRKAIKVIKSGIDPLLTRQNEMNLEAGKKSAPIFKSSPEAIQADRFPALQMEPSKCGEILMGMGDNLRG